MTPTPLGARKITALRHLTSTTPTTAKTTLYLHLDHTQINGGVGRVEQLGPATTTKIREWIGHAYDDTGPPGQTRPDNLAPLCRRHHRAKTTGRWTYQRLPDGTYTWTRPGLPS